MNRLKVGFLISILIVLITIIVIPFLMPNPFGNSELACYIVAKVLLGITLLCSCCFIIMSKAENGSKTVIVGLSLFLQLVPLGLRYLLLSDNSSKFVWYTIILAVALIAYILIGLGLSFQNSKMEKRDGISAGNEIPVQEEKRLATDGENK